MDGTKVGGVTDGSKVILEWALMIMCSYPFRRRVCELRPQNRARVDFSRLIDAQRQLSAYAK